MEPSRRNQIALGVLVIVLALLIYRALRESASTATPIRSAQNVRSENRSTGTPEQADAPDVHLNALEADRPKPGESDRNLFRFKPRSAPRAPAPAPAPLPGPVAVTPTGPPPAPAPAPLPGPVAVTPTGPPPAPSLPPIALKFIGIVEAPERGQKIAVMSDQYGVYYGREGDAILGQYKILRIGAESIDIAYLDGRGRQTIRLSGS